MPSAKIQGPLLELNIKKTLVKEVTDALIRVINSAGISFKDFQASLNIHKCPICKGKQIYYMDTWLCPKCQWEVIYELNFDRRDVKKIRGEDYYRRKKEKR